MLSLIPAALVAVTSFTRIIIVLSMLRQALGMQETPPNTVLVGLALFLTLFTMMPVVNEVNDKALAPSSTTSSAPRRPPARRWRRCACSWCARRANRTSR